jgi:SAM-dependent MidA family methyltransferase
MATLSLPQPGPEALAHSQKLAELIRREIAENSGRIGFERYFELTQYAAGLGYYSAGLRKFGRDGDFVTAPELGDVFARGVVAVIEPLLRDVSVVQNGQIQAGILEIGCGTGALAADVLTLLAQRDCLPAHYWLLERSADLRARQRETLSARVPELMARITWLDAPPAQAWSGVILGNEIIDALAPRRFEVTAHGACELCVTALDDGSFAYVLGAPCAEITAQLGSALASLPLGYRSEFQPQLAPWLAGVSGALQAGAVLLFDYGYAQAQFYMAQRTEGTLVCHYQHRMFDAPFLWPGLVDLSSSVNFTALAQAGAACDLALAAYVSQAEFLRLSCLAELGEGLAALSERERLRLTREIRMLTLPGEMGERIQLMAFTRNVAEATLAPALTTLGLRYTL